MQNTVKTAFVTGAARRVGREIAKLLHAEKFNIALHYYLSEKEAKMLCQEFNQLRPNPAILLKADLNQTEHFSELMTKTLDAFGRLDVLVNNASRFYKTAIGATTEIQWNDLFDANLKAPFFLSQAALPHLKKQQGCIVNITDVHGERPMQDYSVYSISKAGLIMLTKVLAKECGPLVRVNAVSPGAVMLPEGENALSEDAQQKILQRIALQRMGTPDAIARAVLFLVRDADYMTGEVLAVDGGRSLFI